MHDIDSTRQCVDLASCSNVDDQQAVPGPFFQGAQEDDRANQKGQPKFQSYESYQPMGKQELDSIGDPYALLLAGLEERERVLRVEEENMQNFFCLQETLVWNKTAASIQERDARRRLTSSFRDMSSPSFPSGCTEFPFLSVHRYSTGTNVVIKGLLFRRPSQSTCFDVEFQSWSRHLRRIL